jgi:hypothetical protein
LVLPLLYFESSKDVSEDLDSSSPPKFSKTLIKELH